jgi:hypothetical protein
LAAHAYFGRTNRIAGANDAEDFAGRGTVELVRSLMLRATTPEHRTSRCRFAVIVLAAVSFAGIAPGNAQTRDDPESRTTVVPYTTPPEPCCQPGQSYYSTEDREARNPVDWGCWPVAALTLALVAPIAFWFGRSKAPKPPVSKDVRQDIKDAFEEQVRLGEKVYNWNKLAPVLGEAETAVLKVLKKHKL